MPIDESTAGLDSKIRLAYQFVAIQVNRNSDSATLRVKLQTSIVMVFLTLNNVWHGLPSNYFKLKQSGSSRRQQSTAYIYGEKWNCFIEKSYSSLADSRRQPSATRLFLIWYGNAVNLFGYRSFIRHLLMSPWVPFTFSFHFYRTWSITRWLRNTSLDAHIKAENQISSSMISSYY